MHSKGTRKKLNVEKTQMKINCDLTQKIYSNTRTNLMLFQVEARQFKILNMEKKWKIILKWYQYFWNILI